MTFKLRALKFEQQLARGRSGAQPSGHWIPGRETEGVKATGLTHVLESKNRKASGTEGRLAGGELGVSRGRSCSHGAEQGQLNFILCAEGVSEVDGS